MKGPNFDFEVQGAMHNFDPNGAISNINLNINLPTYCYNAKGRTDMTYLTRIIHEKVHF